VYPQAFRNWQAGNNLANGIVLATSTAAASAQIRTPFGVPQGPTSLASVPNGILISNISNAWLFYNLGQTSTLSAAAVPVATNIPVSGVPPNSQCSFLVDDSVQWISVIIAAGTGVVLINLGEGM